MKALWALYTAALIYATTLMPARQLAAAERLTDPWGLDPGASARHALLFFVEGALSSPMGWDGLALSVSLGGATELLQAFIPWRTYDPLDLFANLVGALSGYAAMRLITFRESGGGGGENW